MGEMQTMQYLMEKIQPNKLDKPEMSLIQEMLELEREIFEREINEIQYMMAEIQHELNKIRASKNFESETSELLHRFNDYLLIQIDYTKLTYHEIKRTLDQFEEFKQNQFTPHLYSYISKQNRQMEKMKLKIGKMQKSHVASHFVTLHKQHLDIRCFLFTTKSTDFVEKSIRTIVKEAEILSDGYAFIQPSSTYHRFMSGLTGGKMSSSIPGSNIALSEEPKIASKKVMKAKTGGYESVDVQRALGGEYDKCSVYELCLFHLVDDDAELVQIQNDCTSGSILCGECKKKAAAKLESFLEDLHIKREEAFEKLPLFGINYQRK